MTICQTIILGILLILRYTDCTNTISGKNQFEILHEKRIGITDLQLCDIIVKPNHNWLPGTSWVKGGNGFGHAAIVISGAKDTCTESLLAKTIIFESNSRDVPVEYQLRKVQGNLEGTDYRIANNSFGKQYEGYRYRLRPDISEKQKKDIIEFILKQDPDTSCWRALKAENKHTADFEQANTGAEKNQWYCSLLIWQAFYSIAGIDLDSNQGTIVYPNDLIANPFFDNTPDNHEKRVRF